MTDLPGTPEQQSTGQLISRLTDDLSTLVRDELKLAQAEMSGKAKKAGIGAGMFGAAGVLALFGLGALVAAAILALALVVAPWLAALIVGVVILVVAGVVALVGKNRVGEAGSPVPDKTVESVKADVGAVRGAREQGTRRKA